MTSLDVPRSAVAVAIGVLAPVFPGVQIASKAPETDPWPLRWIRVSRVGGQMTWALDRAVILVECWASTQAGADDPVQAETDALTAFAALDRAPDPAAFFTGGSITELADPDYRGRFARVQFTGTLAVPR